jgi:hypothetical protein
MNIVKILFLLVWLLSTFITKAVLQQFEKKLVLENTWSSFAITSASRLGFKNKILENLISKI